MYSATYRRELNKTVARESAHLWAYEPDEQEEAFARKIGVKASAAATRRTPRKSKTLD